MTFSGEKLASVRRKHGLTQTKLAKAAGLSQVSISMLEKGHKQPSVRTLAKLAGALGIAICKDGLGVFFDA